VILHDLITRVNREMRNNPGVQVDEDDKVALINEAMLRVLGDEPWRFLMRRPEITIYADYSGIAAPVLGIGTRASFSNGNRAVTKTVGDTTIFLEWMEGQKLTGPDDVVYRVCSVDLTDGQTLFLDRPYEGTTANNVSDWTITHDRLQLPRDCVEYYGIVDRTGRRRIHTISAREDEVMQLSRTAGGDITVVLDELSDFYKPVETVLTATTDGGGGNSLTAGIIYEYCQTIEEFGRESHGTRIATAAVTTGSLKNVSIDGVIKETEQRARVYRRDVTNRGGWYLLHKTEPGVSLPTYDDDGQAPFTLDTSVILQQDGPTEYLRVYRKPGADTVLELRYLAKPRRLISNNDAPQMPEQYHEILWRLAVSELHARKGAMSMAGYHRNIVDARIASMRNKYLDRADRTFIKKPMAIGASRWDTRYGDPTKT
jgi:hypothetical protein